jgi:hypothetical protein
MNGIGGLPGAFRGADVFRATAWRAQQYFAAQDYELLTATAIPQWDVGIQQVRFLTLKASTTHTMAFPTGIKRGATYILGVKQPSATGNAAITWTAQSGAATNGAWRWPAATAPTITVTASAMTLLTFVSDGVDMIGVSVLDLR